MSKKRFTPRDNGRNKSRFKKYDKKPLAPAGQIFEKDTEIRLNKYIAHSGFCSRRDADKYITDGKVKVNGKTVTELGVAVRKHDKVEVAGQMLSLEPYIYILLNKPRNTITTTSDERGRNTVMDEIENATGLRVYPVGRLDRNTTGLLILTNDGDLTHRLTHPKYNVSKTYEVTSERVLNEDELRQLMEGIELEDGPARGFNVQKYVDEPKTILITVGEGRNHLIRRMIQYFDTEVTRLKRVEYAGLNLKDVRIGRWRYLKQDEINNLRRMVRLGALDFNK